VLVGELFPGVERATGAELFEDVLAVGEGQLRVLGLLAFAAGDGAVGKVATARVLRLDRGGEWERVKAARLDVNRVVAEADDDELELMPILLRFQDEANNGRAAAWPDQDGLTRS
jgi:hypothetical protein